MKSVILFTDEPALGLGLGVMLSEAPGFELTHIVRDMQEFTRTAAGGAPDLLLLDLAPESDLGLLRELTRVTPSTKIVLWTRDISTELAYQALELGVRGVLSSTSSIEALVRCLDLVARGEIWMERDLTMNLLTSRPVALTRRQSELLRLLVQGLKNKEIAAALGISEGTVKAYLTRLFEKVGAKDRFELALFGLKNMSHLRGPESEGARYGNLRSIVLPRAVQRPTA